LSSDGIRLVGEGAPGRGVGGGDFTAIFYSSNTNTNKTMRGTRANLNNLKKMFIVHLIF
jgi:hypothetical protein